MNNKLVFAVMSAMCLFCAIYAGESSGSGSSSQSAAAPEAQLCTICQYSIEPGQAIVDGREPFGCAAPHVFHKICLYDEHGELKTQSCPLCRATKEPDTARAEASALRDYVRDRDDAELLAAAFAPEDAVVLPSLADVARPAGVSEPVWQKAVDSLRDSHNTRLEISGAGLTTEQWNVLLAAISDSIRRTITELYVYCNQLTTLPGLEHFTQLTDLNVSDNQLTALPGLGNLERLRRLDVYFNSLGQPASIIQYIVRLFWSTWSTALPGLENLIQLRLLMIDRGITVPDAVVRRLGSGLHFVEREDR